MKLLACFPASLDDHFDVANCVQGFLGSWAICNVAACIWIDLPSISILVWKKPLVILRALRNVLRLGAQISHGITHQVAHRAAHHMCYRQVLLLHWYLLLISIWRKSLPWRHSCVFKKWGGFITLVWVSWLRCDNLIFSFSRVKSFKEGAPAKLPEVRLLKLEFGFEQVRSHPF